MRFSLTAATLAAALAVANAVGSLPASPIRGVNLGGLFIVERWMMSSEWNNMGCGAYEDEFDCMANVNAQDAFTKHWDTWITQDDINQMKSYGLNTVRIPVGYWIVESTVDTSSEPFAKGGFYYLDRLIGWINQAGMYAIIDLHGAPGAQTTDVFTGQNNPNPGFFDQYNYNRAYDWAKNITTTIYQNDAWRNTVFAIEAVNEPRRDAAGGSGDMVSNYYPNFLSTVRSVEQGFGVSCSSPSRVKRNDLHARALSGCLNVMYMDGNWGAGEPTTNLPDGVQTPGTIFDDHEYIKYAIDQDSTASPSDYLSFSCKDDRTNQEDTPVIVGEWSLTTQQNGGQFDPSSNQEFYKQWFGAQVEQYEKAAGWIFWTWKTQLNDPRWDYQLAVQQGIIPSDPNNIDRSGC